MGVAERIISLMPKHERYIEPFFGSGAIYLRKRPATSTIINDIDAEAIRERLHFVLAVGAGKIAMPVVEVGDALALLKGLTLSHDDLIYCDPPYMMEARGGRRLYDFEYTDAQHADLLSLLSVVPARVMLSGYRTPLYDDLLRHWPHREDIRTMTRGGPRVESVWCNFVPGVTFHDTRFIGENYRERERIKKRKARWVARFQAMTAGERAVISAALAEAGEAGQPLQLSTQA